VAVGEGGVWVASGGGCSASISHIDPETNTVVAEIPVDVVTDVAAGAGAVWAAGSVCSEGTNEGVVFRVDPQSDMVVATIPVACISNAESPDCHPSDVVAGEAGVWVSLNSDENAGEIVRIDPETNEVLARIAVQGWPRDLVVGEGALWAFTLTEFAGATVEGGSLLRIDPRTNEVTATLLRGELVPGGGTEIPPAIAAGEGGVWVWAKREQTGFAATRIDARTNELTSESTPLEHFFPFTVGAGGVWFIGSSDEGATLARLNPRTLEIDQSVALEVTPIDAAFDSSSGAFWIADYWPSVVRVDLRASGNRLEHDGFAIDVPAGWDGRVFSLAPSGSRALLQVANFELPDQEGLEPPPELPPGEEDPIKAMSGDDVLITLSGGRRGPGESTPPSIRPSDFLPPGPQIPRGHTVAEHSFCWNGACVEVTVDFARSPPDPDLIESVNQVLASVSFAPR